MGKLVKSIASAILFVGLIFIAFALGSGKAKREGEAKLAALQRKYDLAMFHEDFASYNVHIAVFEADISKLEKMRDAGMDLNVKHPKQKLTPFEVALQIALQNDDLIDYTVTPKPSDAYFVVIDWLLKNGVKVSINDGWLKHNIYPKDNTSKESILRTAKLLKVLNENDVSFNLRDQTEDPIFSFPVSMFTMTCVVPPEDALDQQTYNTLFSQFEGSDFVATSEDIEALKGVEPFKKLNTPCVEAFQAAVKNAPKE